MAIDVHQIIAQEETIAGKKLVVHEEFIAWRIRPKAVKAYTILRQPRSGGGNDRYRLRILLGPIDMIIEADRDAVSAIRAAVG